MELSESVVRSEVRGFVERRIAAKGGPPVVTDEESLVDRGVIDSMGIFQLVAFLEEKFGIKVADQEISEENFSSIDTIAAFVMEKA